MILSSRELGPVSFVPLPPQGNRAFPDFRLTELLAYGEYGFHSKFRVGIGPQEASLHFRMSNEREYPAGKQGNEVAHKGFVGFGVRAVAADDIGLIKSAPFYEGDCHKKNVDNLDSIWNYPAP